MVHEVVRKRHDVTVHSVLLGHSGHRLRVRVGQALEEALRHATISRTLRHDHSWKLMRIADEYEALGEK
jgi:hypothetical protein